MTAGQPPIWPNDAPPDPPPIRGFRGVLTRSIERGYDGLGLLVAASLAFCLAAVLFWSLLPPALFGNSLLLQMVRVALLSVPIQALWAGPLGLARAMRRHEARGMLELIWGVRDRGLATAATGALSATVALVGAGDAVFLLSRPSPWLKGLAVIPGYYLLVWLPSQLYAGALAVAGLSPRRAFVQAHLLVLSEPGLAVGIAATLLIMGAAGAVLWIAAAAVAPMFIALIGDEAVAVLAAKYGERTAERSGPS